MIMSDILATRRLYSWVLKDEDTCISAGTHSVRLPPAPTHRDGRVASTFDAEVLSQLVATSSFSRALEAYNGDEQINPLDSYAQHHASHAPSNDIVVVDDDLAAVVDTAPFTGYTTWAKSNTASRRPRDGDMMGRLCHYVRMFCMEHFEVVARNAIDRGWCVQDQPKLLHRVFSSIAACDSAFMLYTELLRDASMAHPPQAVNARISESSRFVDLLQAIRFSKRHGVLCHGSIFLSKTETYDSLMQSITASSKTEPMYYIASAELPACGVMVGAEAFHLVLAPLFMNTNPLSPLEMLSKFVEVWCDFVELAPQCGPFYDLAEARALNLNLTPNDVLFQTQPTATAASVFAYCDHLREVLRTSSSPAAIQRMKDWRYPGSELMVFASSPFSAEFGTMLPSSAHEECWGPYMRAIDFQSAHSPAIISRLRSRRKILVAYV
jgi:hypothetical protein